MKSKGENDMNRYVLGIDIGITSVGFGIIDLDTGEFIDFGVRLFNEGTPDDNISRRAVRGRRRSTSRKKNRILDMKKTLELYGMYDKNFKPVNNIYEVRVKGLYEKLSKEELAAAILNLTKHRGTTLEIVEEDDKEKESIKGIIQQNSLKIKEGKHVCEVQLEKLKTQGSIRGHDNLFTTSQYVAEMEALLKKQEISEEIRDKIIEIMKRKRPYYEGPGSEKSLTPYGRYYEVDGEIRSFDLIEKMIGKCSVYPEELRAPKMSLSAELFNFLNDLNNLTIDHEKLTLEQKNQALKFVSKKGGITFKQLIKLLEVEKEDVSNYRVNKKGEGILTEFKGYKMLKKLCKEDGMDLTLNDYEFIDFVMDIVSRKKGIEERRKAFSDSEYTIPDTLLEKFVHMTGVSGYHAMSFRALRELNKELYVTSLNQMQLLHQLDKFGKCRVSYKGKKKIEADDTAILSPVVKRSLRETFKVINALRKKYGEFESIVVEMTRDKNSKEQKDRISNMQKYFENENKKVNTLLEEKGYDVSKINGKTKLKVRLYQQQQETSAYTLSPLDLKRVIEDPRYTEIDHIIPVSISLDDSINNKVLITSAENRLKTNMTPIGAFQAEKFKNYSMTKYIEFVKYNNDYSRKKKDNLLYNQNITKFSEMQKFINRNLVDTSYACRVVLNVLTNYFKDNEIDTKVHTINGKVTARFRKQIQLDKNRSEDYLHHAIDALIVASVKKLGLLNSYLLKYKFDELYDEMTGEVKEIPDEKAYFDTKHIQYIKNLKTLYQQSNQYYNGAISKENMSFPPIKISHKIDTKANRKIADETIYSTRIFDGEEKVVVKMDIYSPDKNQLSNDIISRKTDHYLMKQHDPKTFEKIEAIILQHFNEFKNDKKQYKSTISKGVEKYELIGENPLTAYKKEHGYITKYSKKGNGPAIKTMKYLEKKLGSHVSVTKNYQTKNKNVVLRKIKPYRTDFYLCSDGKNRIVTIKYKDIRYNKEKCKYVIDETWYQNEKIKKKIDEKAKFLCSIHTDELIGIIKNKGDSYIIKNELYPKYHDGVNAEVLKFTGTNDDKSNRIEVKSIFKYHKQERVSIMSCKSIEKYATDVLGNLYKVNDNKLKLEFDEIS